MIIFRRTSTVMPGKLPSALKSSHAAIAYLKKLTGVEYRIETPIGGNPHRISLTTNFESLGDMDAHAAKLRADQKWLDQSTKSAENYVAGSTSDEIWRVL
jgi:hypothetical protein